MVRTLPATELVRRPLGAQPVLFGAQVTVTEHAAGLPHVRSTIKKMAELSLESGQSYPIRNLATRITADVPSKQYGAEVAALYRWVRDNIRYRKDPLGREWLQRPERTIAEQAGDCDDIATLLAALIQSLGHETRFHTVGRTAATQQHVAVEALIDGKWVTVDPVLEPASDTISARADLGKFGQRAPGVRIYWDSEGHMISGHPRRSRGLAGPVTASARRLWDWNPYYPPFGAALHSGMQPAQGGVPQQWSSAYRSDDSPGFWGNRNLRTLAQRQGEPASPVQYPLAGLGAVAFPPYEAKYDPHPTAKWTTFAVKKAVAAFTEYAKRRGFNPKDKNAKPVLQAMWADYFRRHLDKGSAAGVVKVLKAVAKPAIAVARAVVPGVGPVVSAVQAATKPAMSVARIAAPVVKRIAPAVRAIQAAPKPATLPAAVAAWKKPHPKLAAKYPSNSKQVFDSKHKVFRVYVPGKKLSGMGAFAPTISFQLGAQAASPANMTALAQAAVNAVAAFIAKNKKPPAIKVPAVLAFQQADAQLSDDGLWGPNAQAAAAYYLGSSTSQMPGFAAAFAKYPVTWRAPQTVTPAARTAPVSSSSSALAQAAVDAVRAYIASKKTPPTGKVLAVLTFQQGDALLTDDGLWGPNAQLAAAYYLGVSTSTLPAFAKPFATVPITWHAPGTAAPTPVKPAPKPAAKPAATKAAPKPVSQPLVQTTVTKPDGTKVVTVSAPGGAPIKLVPGAPLPGYTEVGHESDNPGLPPVPATPATTSAAAASKKKPAPAKPVTKAKPKPVSSSAPPLPVSVVPFVAPIPADSWADTMPSAGPIPIPPGSSSAEWVARQEATESGDSALLWLTVAYLWLQQRKAA